MTTTSPQAAHPKPAKPRFYQRTWVITGTVLLALVVGTVIGIRGADATNSPQYKAQADELAATESELAFAKASLEDTEESLADTEGTAADLEDRLEILQGHLDERKAALEERRAALKKREAALKKAVSALDDRKARLKETVSDIREREDAVTAAEALIAETTVPGDGTFEVGVDIEGGLYRSVSKRGCHYTVFGDANRNDVLLDKITPGPGSVSLRAGTWFVSRGCGEWTRQ
jgi:hypothetical protein